MDFKEAIVEVLVYEGRFVQEFAEKLADQILMEANKLGLDEPTFNLLWTIISKETLAKREFAEDLAEYILELYHRGGYINKTEQEIERILQMLKPKD
jgi:hypothetical protein